MLKKSLVVLLVIVLLLGIGLTYYKMSMTGIMNELEETHFGGAVLNKPGRDKLEDVFTSTGIVKTDEYKDFDRRLIVYGLTLYIHKSISDDFVEKIENTMISMFPKENMNNELQEDVLQNLYRYKAVLPVVSSENQLTLEIQTKLIKAYSVCDIIMKTDENQTNEVIEHLLHAITDVGLSKSLKSEWGFEKTSEVHQLMNESVTNGYYNIKSYNDFNGDIKTRILIQEYAYWIISSSWDLQDKYGVGDDEWQLGNPDLISEKASKVMEFVKRTIDPIIQVPSTELLNSF